MKRRDFIKVSSAAGILGAIQPGFDMIASPGNTGTAGFDLHPFIKEHPEAVFIYLTSVGEKTDGPAISAAASKLASEMFVRTTDGSGYPLSTKIACKPNWTCNTKDKKAPLANMGVVTDLNFIEGFLNSMRYIGPQDIYLRESSCPFLWKENGYVEMAERNNFNLVDLTSKDYWELGDQLVFKKVDGTVFREVAYLSPMNGPDSFLVNIAKFKAHQMGITASVKNLQGITGKYFSNFCGGNMNIFKTYNKRYHQFFQPDYMEKVAELHKRHTSEGFRRWDVQMKRPPYSGGLYMEHWAQRMLDSYSITNTGINIVEGVYGRDGDGFSGGPHGGRGMDFMSNNVIFGKDAFRVDIITHWLAGHEPGNFGLFHIAMERGLSNVLDPHDIPVYLWENGQARKVNLESLKRTPLLTLYLGKNDEEFYHLVNEQFDYTAWKSNGAIPAPEPSIRALGKDSGNNVVMEVSVPEKGDVYVDILNRDGEVVWRLLADDLEPGTHQVVWDGFSSPGMYNMYVKGMTWDAERKVVIYS